MIELCFFDLSPGINRHFMIACFIEADGRQPWRKVRLDHKVLSAMGLRVFPKLFTSLYAL